jgi:hypothetical protein
MALFDQWGQRVTYQYNAAGDINFQGISEEKYQRLTEELGVTRSALKSFFKILEQQQVPPEDLDHTLRQIATSYKAKLATTSFTPVRNEADLIPRRERLAMLCAAHMAKADSVG